MNSEDDSVSDLLWRIFYGGSSMEDSGVDSTMDSDSDLMMTILGWILKMILCRIFCGGSSIEDLLWRILVMILLRTLIRI